MWKDVYALHVSGLDIVFIKSNYVVNDFDYSTSMLPKIKHNGPKAQAIVYCIVCSVDKDIIVF